MSDAVSRHRKIDCGAGASRRALSVGLKLIPFFTSALQRWYTSMAAYIASRSPAVDLVTPIARIRWLAPRVIGSHFDPSFVLSLSLSLSLLPESHTKTEEMQEANEWG